MNLNKINDLPNILLEKSPRNVSESAQRNFVHFIFKRCKSYTWCVQKKVSSKFAGYVQSSLDLFVVIFLRICWTLLATLHF